MSAVVRGTVGCPDDDDDVVCARIEDDGMRWWRVYREAQRIQCNAMWRDGVLSQ
jgi:hypothetical protein